VIINNARIGFWWTLHNFYKGKNWQFFSKNFDKILNWQLLFHRVKECGKPRISEYWSIFAPHLVGIG